MSRRRKGKRELMVVLCAVLLVQTQALKNLSAVVAAAGADLSNVVKTTVCASPSSADLTPANLPNSPHSPPEHGASTPRLLSPSQLTITPPQDDFAKVPSLHLLPSSSQLTLRTGQRDLRRPLCSLQARALRRPGPSFPRLCGGPKLMRCEQVAKLPLGVLVEIEAIAINPASRKL